MSVRKRKWTTSKGVHKEAWLVDYVDQHGERRAKTFDKKKDADAYALRAGSEVRDGLHVVDSTSKTVNDVGLIWLTRAQNELEHGTYLQYKQHLNLHIKPFIGNDKLSRMNMPNIRKFLDALAGGNESLPEDDLRRAPRSPAMVKAVRTSLSSIFSEAKEDGYMAQNPLQGMRSKRKKGEKRRKQKLQYGVDIPTLDEINKLIAAATGRFRPLLITAVFTGLRASELRGLRWADVDLAKSRLNVTQRADNFHVIGMPKSETSQRTIPLYPPFVVNVLKEWKLQCPKGEKKLDLVFPNTIGNIEAHGNIIRSGLIPTMLAAGVTVDTGEKDENGKPILAPKYTGLHAFRHWFASWCLNREKDGGRGLLPMRVQKLLGHSTIGLTMDTYGHLFEHKEDDGELDTVMRSFPALVVSAT
ncbi:site-specific integrase [Mesorhizobium sp. B2-4-17]|uniref:tyrosine-type recombinase/integrase n=1 Tax=Mesorhizobium sp. B2-4-17 TaxID=2589932 RepID=UPI0011260ACF|nr:site-specific integrase [Mesorhizobium sp. B2-4-17]TPK85226.1 site-specific integrase [Mesorhizobium sp. B2-4-17]